MTRPNVPLAGWESRVWLGGVLLAIVTASAIVFLEQIAAPAWLLGVGALASMIGITAFAALAVRRAYEHQSRLQDEAESLRTRYSLWDKWLSTESPPRTAGTRSGLPLTPQTLAEFSVIHERAHAVALQLQRDRAEANAVLANLDGGVIALDPDCNITLINDAAARFFQIRRACLGQPMVQVIRQPEIVESVKRVLQDQSIREITVEILGDDRSRRSLRVRCSSLNYGNVAGVLITAHDESETRRSDEVRREFVANVSHELKTPLAAIKGYAETVEMAIDDDPEAAKHFVSQIREQCKRLESLIADMMTLARAQAGSQHLRPTTVDLQDIIAESIKTYAPVAAARRIALTHLADSAEPVLVHADREATLTIANNVIGNAIRYTPEGGAVVAGCRSEASFGVLSVQDNGIGIAENEQQRIFERFYRGDRSRKHSSSGTGLGLSIVKNLTQAQGGEVRLRSRQGEGSTFEIFLPAPAAKLQPAAV
ncbi:MAG: sensor histidine kinase [Planctomycetaceae bacterium]